MMMQIVTDSGCDLSDEQKRGLPIHVVPLGLVLNGVSYDKNHPITPAELYQKMVETDVYPSTSQASAEILRMYIVSYRKREEILSIHISSGLSRTLNSAKVGGALVPNAKSPIGTRRPFRQGWDGRFKQRRWRSKKVGHWIRFWKGWHSFAIRSTGCLR